MFSAFDHQCMTEAFRAARKGRFTTDPNPRVGCVLANHGEVIAVGWHEYTGGPHAETMALEKAGDNAAGATAYVTLEPCSHQGRTPPCAESLIKAGVSRVVAAMEDPNPEVSGNGLGLLRNAGINVDVGLLAAEAEALNPGFLKRMRQHSPWVRVKLALSLDGRTALKNGTSSWITSGPSRSDVQNWRASSSAVLTGIETILSDDPSLNARVEVPCVQPLRVIADSRWRIPQQAKTLQLEGPVIVAGREDLPVPDWLEKSDIECLRLPGAANGSGVDLSTLLSQLALKGVNEVHVEAGATLAGALLELRLIDEILIYQAPVLLGSEARESFSFGPLLQMSEKVAFKVVERVVLGPDLRMRLFPDWKVI